MLLLHRTLYYGGEIGQKRLSTVFDISFNLSCIHPDQLKEMAYAQKIGVPRVLKFASHQSPVIVKQVVCLDFYINDILLSDEFLVVPELNREVIIGAATIRKWRIYLNLEDDIIEVDPKVAKMQLI